LGVTAFGSLFQIGWGFASACTSYQLLFPDWQRVVGIAFAIITCAPTSGGHFNPAVTICFAVWQGFPWRKVPHCKTPTPNLSFTRWSQLDIFSQIFGAFIAGLFVMGMYHEQIQVLKAEFAAKGLPYVMNGGPASILCTFPNADQNNLGYLFL
jgi:glycerol uptake facilitator-like aquaporin